MKNDELIEPQKLVAYCNGELDDEDAVEAIRSSEVCKKWISEHRFIRILAKSDEQEYMPSEVSRDKLSQFVAEELSSQEMLEVESALTRDPRLLEEFLAIRTEHIANSGPAIPEELDNKVLNLLLSNAMETSGVAEGSIHNIFSEKVSGIQKFFAELVSANKLYWAGGVAAVLLLVIVGVKQIGLIGSPDGRPLIVASMESSDIVLNFRGIRVSKKPITISKGELILIELQMVSNIGKAVIGYESRPSKETLSILVAAVNETVKRTALEARDARFDLRKIDGVQVHPSLWEKIKLDGASNSKIIVSIVKIPDRNEPLTSKKMDQKSQLNVLYFSPSK
jgi:hypothetical protein